MDFDYLMVGDFVYKSDKVHQITREDFADNSTIFGEQIPLTVEFFTDNGFKKESWFDNNDNEIVQYTLYDKLGRIIYVPDWEWINVIVFSEDKNKCNNIAVNVKYIDEVQRAIRMGKLYDIANNLKVEKEDD